MVVRRSNEGASRPEQLSVTNQRAAGIDVHAAEHWVAVPPEAVAGTAVDPSSPLPLHVRRFGTFTADLEALADWLEQCGVTTVAMESTGVYWIPLFELLERRGLHVILVDPRQMSRVPGRPKSDFLDCQWIQRLHSYGLLAASFRPEDQVVVLRSYLRQRQMLIGYASQHVQHAQKALEQMNVKLTEVVSDVMGVTGQAIIRAILQGERDPKSLASLRQPHCKRSLEDIAKALHGNWRAEHLLALRQAIELYDFYHRQLQDCDAALAAHVQTFADRSEGRELPPRSSKKTRRRANEPTFDVRAALYRMCGQDLTVIEGIDTNTSLVILSEIGWDMSKWPTVKHFVSWLGLCPQHRGSAGKIRSRRIRRGSSRAGRALRLAAQGCHHAKNALGAFYRRIQARSGGAKAVVATARKIGERVYRLLKYGESYVRQEMAAYEAKYRDRLVRGLLRKARELGLALVPTEAEVSAPS